jgi:hypothetical protein
MRIVARMHVQASLLRRAAAPSAGVVLLGAVLAPSAHAGCANPVADGRNSVVDCRPLRREQAFVVPPGVRRLHVVAAGAPGGGQSLGGPTGGGGGAGAVATADIVVKPGRRLFVLVGGIGLTGGDGAGGYNGGGRAGGGSAPGGGGGGASDVRTCSRADRSCDTIASRLIVAAGGGGGGGEGNFLTGDLGGRGGSATADGTGAAGAGPGGGQGATAAHGGAGGEAVNGAAAGFGRVGAGGDGARGAGAGGGGGGGGGGHNGGGGGAAGTAGSGSGGGAGSSSGPAGTRFAMSQLQQGLVRITYVTPRAGNPLPAVRTALPRAGASVSGRRLVVRGRASDASGVRAVALRIERLPRRTGGCTWLDPASGLGRGSCREPPSLSATLRSGGSWSYRVPARIVLPPGRYRVTAYGTDETGIYGNSAPAAARSVTFTVRR